MSYVAASENGLRVDDPSVGIDWLFLITHLLPRDQAHQLLDDAYIACLNTLFLP